jgi:hypothetical protein
MIIKDGIRTTIITKDGIRTTIITTITIKGGIQTIIITTGGIRTTTIKDGVNQVNQVNQDQVMGGLSKIITKEVIMAGDRHHQLQLEGVVGVGEVQKDGMMIMTTLLAVGVVVVEKQQDIIVTTIIAKKEKVELLLGDLITMDGNDQVVDMERVNADQKEEGDVVGEIVEVVEVE